MSRLLMSDSVGAVVATVMGGLAMTFVGNEEGLRLSRYTDIRGIKTICYGETEKAFFDKIYTKKQCDDMLLNRLEEFASNIEKCITKPMSPKTEVAFISLAYNIGYGRFCKSTVAKRYNAGDREGACNAILLWSRAGSNPKALIKRRKREQMMCLTGLK
ncbi:lysozyme [Methylobacterium indicum]|uniref:lysozyme n=1 Tax=Methylobacterium indicum TaxID=1775910 RepID=UPI0024357F66|nr:lysozyme [Methylobacterium indicum]